MLWDAYSTLRYRRLYPISKLYYSVGKTVFPVDFVAIGNDKATITFRRQPKDNAEKLLMLNRIAVSGDANAQYNLASMYAEGLGTDIDYNLAYQWYQKSADQELPDGLYGVGWCFFHGKGVEKDVEKALDYFKQAANKGHDAAKKIISDYDKKHA